jgi:hypothetical protein
MADISTISRLVSGISRNINIQSNTLVVGSLKVGSSSPTELTKAILDRLVSLQDGSDIVAAYHHHDNRYFTETELGNSSGVTGSDLIGDDNSYSNFTPTTATIKGALAGIDNALSSGSGLVKVSAADTTPGYLNSSLTAGSGLSKSITNPAGDEVLDLAVNVDDSTIEINADTLRVKDAGISAAKLASDAVTTAKILDANVTTAKLAANAVTTAKIAAAAVTATELATDSVTTVKIANSAVTDAKIASGVDAAKIADGSVSSTEFQYINSLSSNAQAQLDGKVAKAGSSMDSAANITFVGGGEVLGLPSTPSSAGSAASKAYVDAVALGLAPKKAVRAATLVSGTFATAFANGQVIDGVTLATGDRILLKNQATASQNGIYVVNASGAPTRATDMDSLSPIDEVNGAWVPVQAGSQVGQVFVQYGVVATLGTDPINFDFYNPIASLIGGDMVTVNGSSITLDLASDAGLQSSNPGDAAGQLRVKLDGATLSRSASGLKVSALGISATELASDAVTTAKILDANVTTGKIAAAAVTNAKLASDAVATVNIIDANVTAAKLASDSVTTVKILDANVTAAKLATDSVTAIKIQADSVTTAKILDANVTTAKLAATSVTAAKLGSDVAGAGLTGGNGSAIAVDFATATSDNKAWKASDLIAIAGAARIGFDNTTAALSGAPATVQAAIDALDTRLDGLTSSAVYLTFVAGEALSAGDIVYLSTSVAGEALKADSDALATCEGVIGIADQTVSASGSVRVQIAGMRAVSGSGFVAGDRGKRMYVSGTAGAATPTAPSATNSVVFLIGHLVNHTAGTIVIAPNLIAINE